MKALNNYPNQHRNGYISARVFRNEKLTWRQVREYETSTSIQGIPSATSLNSANEFHGAAMFLATCLVARTSIERLPRIALYGRSDGSRPRGRPRKK